MSRRRNTCVPFSSLRDADLEPRFGCTEAVVESRGVVFSVLLFGAEGGWGREAARGGRWTRA